MKEEEEEIYGEFLSALKLRIFILCNCKYVLSYNNKGYSLFIDLILLAPRENLKILNSANTINLHLSRNSYRGTLLRRFEDTHISTPRYFSISLPLSSNLLWHKELHFNPPPNSLCLSYLYWSKTLTYWTLPLALLSLQSL